MGWGGGMAVGYTAGGFLHLLLVLVVIVILVRILQGRDPLQ